jgi:hypothetical protein
MNVELPNFEKELQALENLILKKGIQQSDNYKDWYYYFVKIYGKKRTNLQLFAIHSLICLIAKLYIVKYILNLNKIISEVEKDIKKKYDIEFSSEFYYFEPFFDALKELESYNYSHIVEIIISSMNSLKINPEYNFDAIVQHLLSSHLRHKSGEFYTPPFIVRSMVEEAYSFGDKVIDPCCGSGNFLIEIIKNIMNSKRSDYDKLRALKNVYGCDINPISLHLTKINLLFLLKEKFTKFCDNFKITDFLFQNKEESNEDYDLIIGNPPWFTLRDINSPDYQEKVKSLSEALEIKPLPKNVLNIEIASLFFYKAKITHMKKGGKIFFVITKGVINGSHAARFRNFKGFNNIKIWMFTREITDIFNIDFICIFAQKIVAKDQNSNLKIPFFLFSMNQNGKKLNYFDSVNLILDETGFMQPYNVETKAGKTYSNKLVSSVEYNTLIPIRTSDYKKLFHKGADLNPRNLIFVSFKKLNDNRVEINPDNRIFKRAKEPWNRAIFRNEIIEREYLFKVIKSTELVKFYVYDYYTVFLPLKKDNLEFSYTNLKKNAKNFYDKINQFYLKNKKESTKNNSLMDNLNRWSKLINSRQTFEIKVVYNNSGSTVNSAVVQGDFLITGDLSFYSTNNIKEAYYLSAILNSPLVTEQVQIKKSSRHIFKIPFELPIKLFNETNNNHLKLANLAKRAHAISESLTVEALKRDKNTSSKVKIQALINKHIAHILKQIDEIVKNELKSL